MGFDTYLRFVMVLVLVIGMIVFVAWLVRRLGLLNRLSPGSALRGGTRRLAVIESCPLDTRRRLVLVRRDRTEHLILLTGAGSGVVIERGVGDGAGANKRRDGKAGKAASARRREARDWDDAAAAEDEAAAKDESVSRFAGLLKSAWR